MSKLISGKEALIAICDGIDVEHRMVGVSEFGDNPKTKYLLLDNFLNGSFEFRLKPRTITINGVEYIDKQGAYEAFMEVYNEMDIHPDI